MKKTFLSITMAAMLAVSGLIFSTNVGADGSFDGSAAVNGGGTSFDLEVIPNGFSFGGGIATGEAEGGYVGGWIFNNGTGTGYTSVIGGGVTNTTAYVYDPGYDLGIGVGSTTNTLAVTGGTVGGSINALGLTVGAIEGEASQGSFDFSAIGASPLPVWDSAGSSSGFAGQSSEGEFSGAGGALFVGAYDITAGVNMEGTSFSQSYRAIDFFSGGQTEYMGTQTGAFTDITTVGTVANTGIAGGTVSGDWNASGFVSADTTQALNGGNAMASVNGSYSASGSLGQNLDAHAIGTTQTSATSFDGFNGSIMTSSSSASVSAVVTP